MAIHLAILGGLRVRREESDLSRLLGQRLRAALFVYLAVERSASRESLTSIFWPESTGENARHALRQSLYHLRVELGADWLDVRAHEVCVSETVSVDAHDFVAALDAGDPESAARLYRGPFLEGVNLVDLVAWERWVDGRRALYARAFRKACREWAESRRAAGDFAGAVEAARHWVGPDPLDDEAQHRLIVALADAGHRNEAIRHHDAYARMLEADGLHPLDETTALITRIRADASALPALAPPHDGPRPTGTVQPGYPGADRGGGEAQVRAAQPRVRGRAPALAAIALGLFIILATTWAIIERRAQPAASASARDIAVLPFAVRGGEDVQYLGDGMVNLLGTALDGVSVRPVDARAVFALIAEQDAGTPAIERGRRLAARLGAGLFVLGDVVQAGDVIHIEAAAYRAGAADEPLIRVSVNGDAERVFELVDMLAARLLAGLGGTSADRLTRTAAVTTSSLSAFKAYLEGEADIRAGRFERAVDAYGRAVADDSTFAVAHYRLALARDWAAIGSFADATRAAARHAERLSPRDRALLDALLAYHEGDALEAERRYRAILARYPDDVEAWFQLGEVQFHYGPLRGRTVAESEDAWRRVISFEPKNLGALVHLARVAAVRGRIGALDSLRAQFEPAELTTDRRLVQIGLFRAIAAHDTATARTLIENARSWEDPAAYQLGAYLTAFSHDPPGARLAVRGLIQRHRAPGMVADMHSFVALLHLASGQPASARRAMTLAVSASAAIPSRWHRYTFELVNDWYVATLPLPWPDSTLERVRSAASLSSSQWNEELSMDQDSEIGDQIWWTRTRETLAVPQRLEALRHYSTGVLSLRLRDRATATWSAETLARLAASDASNGFVRDLDRDLRARAAWADGRPEEGLRILESLELGPASLGSTIIVPFVAHANARYLRGELLSALGRDAEAVTWFASLGELSPAESPFRAPAHLRLAEIHERLGNRIDAARHYSRFIELWQDSEPALQPLVERARQRHASLTRTNGLTIP